MMKRYLVVAYFLIGIAMAANISGDSYDCQKQRWPNLQPHGDLFGTYVVVMAWPLVLIEVIPKAKHNSGRWCM